MADFFSTLQQGASSLTQSIAGLPSFLQQEAKEMLDAASHSPYLSQMQQASQSSQSNQMLSNRSSSSNGKLWPSQKQALQRAYSEKRRADDLTPNDETAPSHALKSVQMMSNPITRLTQNLTKGITSKSKKQLDFKSKHIKDYGTEWEEPEDPNNPKEPKEPKEEPQEETNIESLLQALNALDQPTPDQPTPDQPTPDQPVPDQPVPEPEIPKPEPEIPEYREAVYTGQIVHHPIKFVQHASPKLIEPFAKPSVNVMQLPNTIRQDSFKTLNAVIPAAKIDPSSLKSKRDVKEKEGEGDEKSDTMEIDYNTPIPRGNEVIQTTQGIRNITSQVVNRSSETPVIINTPVNGMPINNEKKEKSTGGIKYNFQPLAQQFVTKKTIESPSNIISTVYGKKITRKSKQNRPKLHRIKKSARSSETISTKPSAFSSVIDNVSNIIAPRSINSKQFSFSPKKSAVTATIDTSHMNITSKGLEVKLPSVNMNIIVTPKKKSKKSK